MTRTVAATRAAWTLFSTVSSRSRLSSASRYDAFSSAFCSASSLAMRLSASRQRLHLRNVAEHGDHAGRVPGIRRPQIGRCHREGAPSASRHPISTTATLRAVALDDGVQNCLGERFEPFRREEGVHQRVSDHILAVEPEHARRCRVEGPDMAVQTHRHHAVEQVLQDVLMDEGFSVRFAWIFRRMPVHPCTPDPCECETPSSRQRRPERPFPKYDRSCRRRLPVRAAAPPMTSSKATPPHPGRCVEQRFHRAEARSLMRFRRSSQRIASGFSPIPMSRASDASLTPRPRRPFRHGVPAAGGAESFFRVHPASPPSGQVVASGTCPGRCSNRRRWFCCSPNLPLLLVLLRCQVLSLALATSIFTTTLSVP